jgi:hypothetical protein
MWPQNNLHSRNCEKSAEYLQAREIQAPNPPDLMREQWEQAQYQQQ